MRQLVHGIMRDLDAEQAAYRKREDCIRLASASLRRAEISRICARYELEPDEFYTAEQKASRYL